MRQTGIPACFTIQSQRAKAALGAQAGMPVFRRDLGLIFVEASVDQRFDFFERARGIGSFTTNLQF